MSDDLKKEKQIPAVAEAVVVVVPAVNDSSEGLARMVADLAPFAARLRSSAFTLLLFSLLFMGTLEGMFGLIAAVGVLCCAAPGSLGTAHAARCTKICAIICATVSLMHIFCLSAFSVMVLPEMPHAFADACRDAQMEAPAPLKAKLTDMLVSSSAGPATSSTGSVEVVALTSSSSASAIVATVTSAATRRLQEVGVVSSADAPCLRAERAFADAAPTLLLCAVLVETALFFSAISTAKAAGRLIAAARSFGANGI